MSVIICRRCLTLAKTFAPYSVFFAANNALTLPKLWNAVQRSSVVCNMVSKVRSQEEKKSRAKSKMDQTAAHEKFPFLPTKTTRQIYVLDKALAGEIARGVRKNQEDPDVPILEANPGPGVLTEALMKTGVKHIVLAEALKNFMPILKGMQKEHMAVLRTVYNWDYVSVWRRLVNAECAYKDYEDKLAEILPHKDWEMGPPVTVIAVIPDLKERTFLAHLLLSCARQYGLFLLGRPEWFLVISPTIYKHFVVAKMENRKSIYYSRLAIILHQVFDIQLCAELPGWKFTPRFPEKRKTLKLSQDLDVSSSMRYLVRLRPYHEQALPLADIPAFFSFLDQVLKRKKQRLIPKMEQLVPGCGVHLIMSGFSMLGLIVDVSPTQFVSIFKAMQTWPEYEGSPLKQHLMESFLTESTVDDDSPDDSQKHD